MKEISRKRFLAVLFLGGCLFGCTDGEYRVSKVLRLVDPNRIETIESEHLDLLEGRGALFSESEAFARIPARGAWRVFYPPLEFSTKGISPRLDLPEVRLSDDGKRLVVPPGAGVACVVRVRSSVHTYIECRGTFNKENGLKAAVIQLRSFIPLDESDKTKPLRAYLLRCGGMGILPMKPSTDGRSASALVKINREARALLVMYTAEKLKEGSLEKVWMCHPTPRQSFLMERMNNPPAHPVISLVPFLEATVRPSLLLLPLTSITFKEIEIPPHAEFRCALGTIDQLNVPVRVSLDGVDRNLQVHNLFRKRVGPDARGWMEMNRDLSAWSGRFLKLRFTCRRDEKGAPGTACTPPLILVGAPALHYFGPGPMEQGYNLIIVSLDTLRADRLGCYGYTRPVSPVMDRFSAENVTFQNAYSQAPYTNASHASLFTSLFPSAHGVEIHLDRIPAGVDLLAEVLSRAGLETASFNNGGLISHELGFHRGFDLYCEVDPIGDRYRKGANFPKKNRLADGSTGSLGRALSWVEENRDRRFFLFLHTFIVHDYAPSEALAAEFRRRPDGLPEGGRESIEQAPFIYMWKDEQPEFLPEVLTDLYDATIRAADRMVGELLDHLRGLGLMERTLVVITSDHGEEFLEHGSFQHAKSVYEELIRVPLLMHIPGMTGGIRVNARVNQVDVTPTLLELMEIEPMKGIHGRSLLPLLGAADPPDRMIFAETNILGTTNRRCIIQGPFKYIWGSTDSALDFPAPVREELFRLKDDPGERNNLLESYPDEALRFKDLMGRMKNDLLQVRERLRSGEKPPEAISERLRETLRQQGYL